METRQLDSAQLKAEVLMQWETYHPYIMGPGVAHGFFHNGGCVGICGVLQTGEMWVLLDPKFIKPVVVLRNARRLLKLAFDQLNLTEIDTIADCSAAYHIRWLRALGFKFGYHLDNYKGYDRYVLTK